MSNLRWFIPRHKDEYTEVVHEFAPEFARQIAHLVKAVGATRFEGYRLHATGHSLGGGLAQQFAYALPTNISKLRVDKVYAFDPSPVTWYFSVDSKTRDANKKGLSIDRIYERGEILSIVRSFTSFLLPASKVDPAIRGVRYCLFYPANPIGAHSIRDLAWKLRVASGHKRIGMNAAPLPTRPLP